MALRVVEIISRNMQLAERRESGFKDEREIELILDNLP